MYHDAMETPSPDGEESMVLKSTKLSK